MRPTVSIAVFPDHISPIKSARQLNVLNQNLRPFIPRKLYTRTISVPGRKPRKPIPRTTEDVVPALPVPSMLRPVSSVKRPDATNHQPPLSLSFWCLSWLPSSTCCKEHGLDRAGFFALSEYIFLKFW